MTATTVVLGLGNVLMSDDGAGVRAVHTLERRFRFPDGVRLVEGGVLGLDLLPYLDGVERLLLVDAVRLGRPPGTIIRLEGSRVPAALDPKLSPHQIGLKDLLGAARFLGIEPAEVVLLGIEPERLEPGTLFSRPVAEALVRLEAAVLAELRRWGVEPEPRDPEPLDAEQRGGPRLSMRRGLRPPRTPPGPPHPPTLGSAPGDPGRSSISVSPTGSEDAPAAWWAPSARDRLP